MMSKTAYLHVGAGKTGTSAIQAALPSLREQLLDHGVLYPEDITLSEVQAKRGEVSSGNALTLARLTNLSLPRPVNWQFHNSVKWLNQCLDLAILHNSDILFSNEHLQFAELDKLQEVLNVILGRGFAVKVIFYVRTAIDYSISAYLQKLKVGAFPSGVPTSLAAHLLNDRLPFWKTLKTFSEASGISGISVRNYDQLRPRLLESFVSDFIPNFVEHKLGFTSINRSLTPLEQMAFETIYSLPNGNSVCKKLGSQLDKWPRDCNVRKFFVDQDTLSIFESNNKPIITMINRNFLDQGTELSINTMDSPIHSDPVMHADAISQLPATFSRIICSLCQE
jgi:hypothetical protein